MLPGTFLAPALFFLGTIIASAQPYRTFSRNGTSFNHLAVDPRSGTVYIGATNYLFQLTADLLAKMEVPTGPVLDSKDCLPPVTPSHCPQARNTDNHNKLLLVNTYRKELITCGSVFQGLCEKRSLESIDHLLFRPDRPVDTQYVAATDPNVTTVGLVSLSKDGVPVLFVGRGYTSKGAGGIPPITTRNLESHSSDPQNLESHYVFSYEDTAKLAVVGRLSEYNHHFVKSFVYRSHIYFLFYRRDLKSQSREYKTYVSRICLDDSHYYSYAELPLFCGTSEKSYSLLQAAFVGRPGSDLANGKLQTAGEVLFGVFAMWQASTGKVSDQSALCVYTLEEIDEKINYTRDMCYTKDGRLQNGTEVSYIEYDVKSNCVQLSSDTLDAYPCGSDHTPSPMASRSPLKAVPVLDSPFAHLTAVAMSVEAGHTIVFLGDSKGHLHKVYLSSAGEAEKYSTQMIQANAAVGGDLLFDQLQEHLYVMMQSTVVKVPVATCSQYLDCDSCLSVNDPYCGWCVLDGRCSQMSECSRAEDGGQWLWSFSPTQQCLSVESLSPSNISREEKRNIFLTVSALPTLWEEESYSCFFEDYESPAALTERGVTCPSPDPHKVPPMKPGVDHVTVALSLRFLNITVATTKFTFYDCAVVKQLSRNMPCRGCVSSRWGCHWCVQQHLCTHKPTCEEGAIIYNENSPPPPPDVPFLNKKQTNKKKPQPTSPTLPVTTATVSTTTLPTTTVPPTTVQPTTLPATVPTTTTSTTEVTTTASPETTAAPTTIKTTQSTATMPVTNPATSLPTTTSPATTAEETTLAPAAKPQTHAVPSSVPQTPDPASPTPLDVPAHLGPELLDSVVPPTVITDWLAEEDSDLKEPDYWVEAPQADNETVPSATATVLLSGDGDVENVSPPFFFGSDSDLDYQHDSPGLFEQSNEAVSWGPSACPCVESIQGSALLPVNVERKVTLVGKNLHLFQDSDWDYECVFTLEGRIVVVDAFVEVDDEDRSVYFITCQLHQYTYSAVQQECNALVYVQRRFPHRVDSSQDLYVTLYNCSVGRSDCSRCQTAESKYSCVWCGGRQPSCVYWESCREEIEQTCPAPVIHTIEPLSGLVEGQTAITIIGSNLGQKHQDIHNTVMVAGIPCAVDPNKYEISTRIVCVTGASNGERSGHVTVEVAGGGHGISVQKFTYQNPEIKSIYPLRGPKAGGTRLTLTGSELLTGRLSDMNVFVGNLPCIIFSEVQENQLECLTSPSNSSAEVLVVVIYGESQRHLQGVRFKYTEDPNITSAVPAKSFLRGGRVIKVYGQNLDVVQTPKIQVVVSPIDRRRRSASMRARKGLRRHRRILPETGCPENTLCSVQQVGCKDVKRCAKELVLSQRHICLAGRKSLPVISSFFVLFFELFQISTIGSTALTKPQGSTNPQKFPRGGGLQTKGENLDLAISKEEVVAMVGEGVCAVKTLTRNHLYCEPPQEQPAPRRRKKREGTDSLPEFTVQMGNIIAMLGKVQYDTESLSTFPLEAQIGLGVGASIVALIVLIIVLIYRRKSKQALRDYKKVQIQLENLETSVRDRCKKEFTDLMTEMMDLTSDLVGTGIPFLDYKSYAERIFFPGHRESPLQRDLDVPESRRQTVEQGLVQLSNLLNSKLFLTKFIHTLESQRTFSARDRAYVASLLTVSLHGKLEYFTDILKTLLNDLVEQYVAKNPKLMLRRTETVVEKLLTNWMSICLYAFLRDSAGESLYMLFRGIKHQVDKGPVDAVTGKAKYTLNDNRLLREDVEYRTLTLNVLMQAGGGDTQPVQVKVLDCDTITQVKEKILDQIYKGTACSLRPDGDSLDLEWRSGLAGHLILSDEDLTSVVQGSWKRLNTLQHYKVPDGSNVTLVPRLSKHIHHENHDYIAGEKTPMLEDADEGGIKPWHLVKASEEQELPKHRRGSLRERERAKAIPEIYLTRLLSMKGTLQKFVDDLFQVILSTSRPVPLAVKYFFDLLDDQAVHHGIMDSETIHIWKTNSLPLRFWINIIKNPQFIFDVQTSDNVDAVLSVIAQTFMDSCTIAEHKLGRDHGILRALGVRWLMQSPTKVALYYSDIRQTISASDQEMNSALAELSRNYSGELNSLVALHELYKYINKYYDQIITALEEDPIAQKMQLGYRLQQIAAAVENKVTDL
uniref:Plexin-B1 n=1 Tax=Latimeria chalumnae TaxID=7897 RepID=H2ZZT0_LATCH